VLNVQNVNHISEEISNINSGSQNYCFDMLEEIPIEQSELKIGKKSS
jgi:hypothetical protein